MYLLSGQLHPSYRATYFPRLTTLGCLKGRLLRDVHRAQTKRQPKTDLLYAPRHISKRILLSRFHVDRDLRSAVRFR